METFVGGEVNWQTWTAVSGMLGVVVDVMTVSETVEDRTIATVLNDAMFVDADRGAVYESHQRLTRCRKRQ